MFLKDNAKLDVTPTKAKLNEKYILVFILIQVLKILLIKKIQAGTSVFISRCFLSTFTSTDIIFATF